MDAGMKWRWTALIVYLAICVFDFMIVPIWFGVMRPDYHMFLEEVRAIDDTMAVSYTHLTLPTMWYV